MPQAIIQSVGRAFEVLDRLAEGSANLATLSQVLGVSAPGTLKIVKTLEQLGMVRQLDDKRYELSGGCGKYARAYCAQHPLRDLARPAMEELSVAAGDRTVLSTLEGHEQVTMLIVDSRQGWRHPELEVPSGPHASLQLATGRVLLAHAPIECAKRQFESYPPGYLPEALSTFDKVQTVLSQVRSDGYAVVSTPREHTRYLAVPVRDRGGRVVAALGLHVTQPQSEECSLKLVRQAAARISDTLVS